MVYNGTNRENGEINMKKALIHYFTGTGNSLVAAEQLTKEECLCDYEFTFHPIEKGNRNDIKDFSLHLFFFPVFATSVPHIVRKYIHNLEPGNMAKAVVISTNGKISTRFRDGYQGWALHQARICLKAKHYDVVLSETLDLPYNVTIVAPPRNDKVNKIILREGLKPLSIIANRITEQQSYHRRIFLANFLWCIPFGVLYSLFGRRGFGKLFGADASCNQCKQCVRECPVKAIRSDGRSIRWKLNCEGCLRCINSCPKHAIQTSTVRLIVMLGAMFLNPFYLIYPNVKDRISADFTPFAVHMIEAIYYVFSVLLFWFLLDQLIIFLSRFTVFRKIFGFGHTRFYGRYHAKKIK